jgi:hypothetical protein
VIRGWFRFDGGAQLIAVSWNPERSTWVHLLGEPVAEGVLKTGVKASRPGERPPHAGRCGVSPQKGSGETIGLG